MVERLLDVADHTAVGSATRIQREDSRRVPTQYARARSWVHNIPPFLAVSDALFGILVDVLSTVLSGRRGRSRVAFRAWPIHIAQHADIVHRHGDHVRVAGKHVACARIALQLR